jgi:hypothetical protein
VVENAADDERVGDEGDDLHPPVAERTLQNIDRETPKAASASRSRTARSRI